MGSSLPTINVGDFVGNHVGDIKGGKKRFGGDGGVNVGEKCRRHVGNMSERKIIENQYVIVLWKVDCRQ